MIGSAEIAALLRTPGPWCTVHVDVSTGTVDSLEAVDVLNEHIQETLSAAGAAKEDAAVAGALTWRAEGVPGPCSRYVLISGGVVRVNEVLPGEPPEAVIATGHIPNLVPLLRATGSNFTYVVVEAERAEAEMRLYRANIPEPLTREEFRGDTENLNKVTGGGSSQGHYQDRTQEIWRRNANVMAAEVDAAVTRHRPGLVIVSGDVRARQLLLDELGAAAAPLVRVIDMNSHPAGADRDKFGLEVDRLVAETVARDQQALLERLDDADAQHRVSGWGETIHALQAAQVETLLLESGVLEDKTALVLDAPPWIATTEEDSLSATPLGKAAGPEALVRAALLTDAHLEFTAPAALAGFSPVAALLRWPAGVHQP